MHWLTPIFRRPVLLEGAVTLSQRCRCAKGDPLLTGMQAAEMRWRLGNGNVKACRARTQLPGQRPGVDAYSHIHISLPPILNHRPCPMSVPGSGIIRIIVIVEITARNTRSRPSIL